jgi:hypothetical protein
MNASITEFVEPIGYSSIEGTEQLVLANPEEIFSC